MGGPMMPATIMQPLMTLASSQSQGHGTQPMAGVYTLICRTGMLAMDHIYLW